MKARDVFKLTGAAALVAIVVLVLPAAASAAPPTLTLNDPTHSIVTAHLSGEVEVPADGFETYWCLEYAEEGVENWSGFCFQGPVQPGETASVESDIGGLKAETSYEARLSALNFTEFVEEHSAVKTFTTDPAVAPSLTIGTAENVGAHSAHIAGTIDPEGGNEDAAAGLLPISWELQIARENANNELEGWNTVGSGELSTAEPEGGGTPPAASNSPVPVEADASGLQPNSHYQFRLVVHYAGLEATSPEEGFDTEALKPDIERETLWEPTETSIQLNALVNPHNSELTDCHFEWGVGSNLDHSTPCEFKYGPMPEGSTAWYEGEPYTPPDNEGFIQVAVRLSGLAQGTEYSFRLVAANAFGTEDENVRSFETLEAPTAETCPNAMVRHQQHADQLPDCRAYEMATPVEKGNGDVSADPYAQTAHASSNGNALAFSSRTPFGDTLGSGVSGHTTYLARRFPDGWLSKGVTPTSNPEAAQAGFAGTRTMIFAEDLSSVTVWAYDLPGVEGDTPKRQNIYAEDTLTRELKPVTPLPESAPNPLQFVNQPVSWGQSADGRHIAFQTSTKYLPQAAENAPNVYQWDEGVLSLAGILPDGNVPVGGSRTKTGPPSSLHTMSADGGRELFYASAGGPTQLYQRIDGSRTAWISEPEGSGGPEPAGIELQAASPDGHTVLFTSATPLLNGEQAGGLYRWTDSPDPAGELNLTAINGFSGDDVVGMSDDGKRIFLSGEVWNEGETRRLTGLFAGLEPLLSYGVLGEYTGRGRVTHSGRYLAFLSPAGFRGPATKWGGWADISFSGYGFQNRMYLYDFRNDSLRCVSCVGSGSDAEAFVVPLGSGTNNSLVDFGTRPRFLAENGRVFFSTATALVAEDTNGLPDAYEFEPDTGAIRLLSSGRGGSSMTFVDASANGNDVFLSTRQPLASPDSDDLVDIYDARVNGGFENGLSATAPCEGESCQPSSSGGAGALRPASQAAGRGNPHWPRCARRARHRRHCGKHKHRHHHKRTVKSDGRVSK